MNTLETVGLQRLARHLYDKLDTHWRSTQEITVRADYEWRNGSWANNVAREAMIELLNTRTDVEQSGRHLWRRSPTT